MACTTILVGKDASYDGSTIIARNEDSANGEFNPKRFVVVKPDEQPREYRSVISHLTIDLPDDPLQYTAVPNADLKEGIWGEAGVNEANVAMSATETLTTNERVLGADPFVEYRAARGREGDSDYEPAVPGGIGEEDFLTIVLPYVTTAREGVQRLGDLLKEYGTYEMNGVAFSDADEIWWMETVGGHHWIAKRVPDEAYVTMPNQLGIDEFDLDDALGEQENHMCSEDLVEFIERNHLDLSVESTSPFNPRDAFGSHSDSDHVYNTPRAWVMQRFLNPYDEMWDGPEADQWIAYGSNPFNTLVPFYPNVNETPKYLEDTTTRVTSENFYWENRIIAALCDAAFAETSNAIERYQEKTGAMGHRLIAATDEQVARLGGADEAAAALADAELEAANADGDVEPMDPEDIIDATRNDEVRDILAAANQTMADQLKTETDQLLDTVLYTVSMKMKNGFNRSDN